VKASAVIIRIAISGMFFVGSIGGQLKKNKTEHIMKITFKPTLNNFTKLSFIYCPLKF